MARGAVVHHLDRRAAQLLIDTGFTVWAHIMAGVIGDRDDLARRLREWTLLRPIALDEPWAAGALTAASDWFRRPAATARIITSSEPSACSPNRDEPAASATRRADGRNNWINHRTD